MIRVVPGPSDGDYYCGFVTLREIAIGEQLTWDYGDKSEKRIRRKCPPGCSGIRRPTVFDEQSGTSSKDAGKHVPKHNRRI